MLAHRPNTPPQLRELDHHLGARIGQRRRLKQLSIAQAALLLQCAEAHVRSLEGGAVPVRATDLACVALVLNTPLAWFFR